MQHCNLNSRCIKTLISMAYPLRDNPKHTHYHPPHYPTPGQKRCNWRFLFIIAKQKMEMDNIFLPNKKIVKKTNCGRLTGHNYGHPLDRKHTFFVVDSPTTRPPYPSPISPTPQKSTAEISGVRITPVIPSEW